MGEWRAIIHDAPSMPRGMRRGREPPGRGAKRRAMKKTVTWILIADGARARILKNEGPGKGLQPAVADEFKQALKPTREIGADRPGRVQESATAERHAIVPRLDWHRFEKERFAKNMAKLLDAAAARNAFDRLILVAPPRTLGDLRAALAPRSRALVTGELGKDLTPLTAAELPDHIYKLLPL